MYEMNEKKYMYEMNEKKKRYMKTLKQINSLLRCSFMKKIDLIMIPLYVERLQLLPRLI